MQSITSPHHIILHESLSTWARRWAAKCAVQWMNEWMKWMTCQNALVVNQPAACVLHRTAITTIECHLTISPLISHSSDWMGFRAGRQAGCEQEPSVIHSFQVDRWGGAGFCVQQQPKKRIKWFFTYCSILCAFVCYCELRTRWGCRDVEKKDIDSAFILLHVCLLKIHLSKVTGLIRGQTL